MLNLSKIVILVSPLTQNTLKIVFWLKVMRILIPFLSKQFLLFLLTVIAFTTEAHGRGTKSTPSNGDKKLKIQYVTIKKMTDSNFKTIREMFNKGGKTERFRCVARDNPDNRAGTYFILGLSKPTTSLPKDLSVKVQLIESLKDGVKCFICPVQEQRSCLLSEIFCGITSVNINHKKISAWKVEILDKDNNVLACRESFMWK